jgi:hypothetical protein
LPVAFVCLACNTAGDDDDGDDDEHGTATTNGVLRKHNQNPLGGKE